MTSTKEISIAIFLMITKELGIAQKKQELSSSSIGLSSTSSTSSSSVSTSDKLLLYGHCLGSLLAFEVCRWLLLYDYSVSGLIVNDCPSAFTHSASNIYASSKVKSNENKFSNNAVEKKKLNCFSPDNELLDVMFALG